ILLFPHVPVWVPLVGVSFPDLLWSVLIWARKEEVVIEKDKPLQKSVIFRKYPYSHSLVLTNIIALVVGGLLAAGLQNLVVLPVFVLASSSHWLLDTVVHLSDLPILGFDGDRKVGLGLWKWGRTAFFVELLFFAIFAGVFVPAGSLPAVLIIGIIFHTVNANSFFGFSKSSPFGSSTAYAAGALLGFALVSAAYTFII
ncbi:MAG: hypothetical protein JRN35_10725, partial [Nitrososphaerota archaeon]|nr:hypothetical protein [Nitrososphaerota archaeon]